MEVSALTKDVAVTANRRSQEDFTKFMGDLLTPAADGTVNEEELFSAIIKEEIDHQSGEEAATKFSEKFAQSLISQNGRVENAAREALQQMSTAGELAADVANSIHKLAFAVSQLDSNKAALWDSTGSATDITKATAAKDSAIASSYALLTATTTDVTTPPGLFDTIDQWAGINPTTPTTPTTPNPSPGTGGGGSVDNGADPVLEAPPPEKGITSFLLRPLAQSTGNMLLMLPSTFLNQIKSVIIKDKDGNEIEKAEYAGTSTGKRMNYKFQHPGAYYPEDLVLEIKLKNGKTERIAIDDPSQTYRQ